MVASPDKSRTVACPRLRIRRPTATHRQAPAGKDVPAGEVSVTDTDTPPDTDTSSSDVDVTADEDDDWPTRYSWLDDEEADEALESDDVTLPTLDVSTTRGRCGASDLQRVSALDAPGRVEVPAGEG